MRIWQATDVEHEIRIERDAVLEAERLKQQYEFTVIQRQQIAHPVSQRVWIQVAGINAMAEGADFFQ